MSMAAGQLRQAQASHARGELDAAIRGYEAVLKREPSHYDAAYFLAVALYQSGRLERAAAGFAAAARLAPRRFEPHKDRGLILMRLGRHRDALASFDAALRLKPAAPELLLNRGLALKHLGDAAAAVDSYQAALRLQPGFAEAHNNLANALALLGRDEEALAAYRRALELKPAYADAASNAAALLHKTGRSAEAVALLDPLLRRDPRNAEALTLRAAALEAGGRDADALADALRAIALLPQEVEALLLAARLLTRAGRQDEAVTLCDRAIAADPANPRAYLEIGRAFEGRSDLAAAVASYDKAIALDPRWASPRLRQAGALARAGRHEDALAGFDALLAAEPDSAEAHLGRADTLRDLRRQAEALAALDRAIALAPERAASHAARASLRSEAGDGAAALADYGRAFAIIAGEEAAAQAAADACLALLSVDKIPAIYASEAELAETRGKVEQTLDRLLEETASRPARSEAERRVAELALYHLNGFYLAYHQQNDRDTMRKLATVARRLLGPAPFAPPPRQDGKIRLGIAAHRLRNHNGANWAYPWLSQLPRQDYEIFTYSTEAPRDTLARTFAALGHHRLLSWSSADVSAIVSTLRRDRLDHLMLPEVGMVPVSRFLSLHRMAPCQFTAWGHPVTTGSPEMDAYLSSDLMEPEDGQDHYTEELVRLPNLALYLEEEDMSGVRPDRAGLPEGRVLYGCLQSLFKYLPRHDAVLPRLAREVPDALFVFLEGSPAYMTEVMRQRLARAFAREGLDAARHVAFLPRRSAAEFDALTRAMDVCVDSTGWSGGNTTLDAIRLGVPLATLPGRFMRGRHSLAMLRMMGADELIAGDQDGYVALLARLGRDAAFRRHASDMFRERRERLWRDSSVPRAFDRFLKDRLRR